jgi:hypothetical protein
MNATEVIIFAGLAALIIGTQMGRHPVTLRRFVVPLAAAAFVAWHYLQTIPTVGGDLDFELALTIAGVALGVLAGSLIKVDRDQQTGKLVLEAGLAYAALWIVTLGGRLAFGWAATNLWSQQIGQFSVQHQITGSAAWTAAFVLSALAMIVARTVVVGARVLIADGRLTPVGL